MVLTFEFLPAFLSRPLRGHPPPGGSDWLLPQPIRAYLGFFADAYQILWKIFILGDYI